MAISVFPVAVTSSSSVNASAITAASANVLYEGRATFDPAIYQISCASGVITNFQFWNGSTFIVGSVTASGVVSVNLSSAADRIRLWTNTGSNTVVTITKTASALTDQFSGTLDTITTSGTYTGTSTSGKAYAVLVGGGGGGGRRSQNSSQGGASGGVCAKIVTLTGSMAVVIGAFGAGSTVNGTNGASGGNSTFDGMTAGGGSGGRSDSGDPSLPGGTATGGSINSTGAATSFSPFGDTGGSTTATYAFIAAPGTTGAGGFGYYNETLGSFGGGSGIGTGGRGGSTSVAGANATGYGAGGGGGGGSSQAGTQTSGGNGSPGVLYVLKF
jgi:hypothetical protein